MQFQVAKYSDLFSFPSFVSFDDATVFNSSWVILHADKAILPDVSHHTNVVRGRPWTGMDQFARGELISLTGADTAARVEVEEAVFVGGSPNYYHFTCDYLGNLANYPYHAEIPLMIDQDHSWQKDLLVAYGLDPQKVITAEKPTLFHVQRLIVPQAVLDHRGALRSSHYAEWISRRTRHILPEESAERIYVSRKLARRSVSNEEEVFDSLRLLGFKMVVPEHLTVEQQISIFKGAKIIVGPTGTNLANIVYCRPGATLIELMPMNTWRPPQIGLLAAGFEIVLRRVLCQGSFNDLQFPVNLDPLKAALHNVI